MTPDVLYTTIIASISIGFFGASIIFARFMEDSARYYVPGFILLSIVLTFFVEWAFFGFPALGFAFVQLSAIPIGSVISVIIFFVIVHLYTSKHPF